MTTQYATDVKYSAAILSTDKQLLVAGEATLDVENPCVIFAPATELPDPEMLADAKTLRLDGLSDFEVKRIIPLLEPSGHWKVFTVV